MSCSLPRMARGESSGPAWQYLLAPLTWYSNASRKRRRSAEVRLSSTPSLLGCQESRRYTTELESARLSSSASLLCPSKSWWRLVFECESGERTRGAVRSNSYFKMQGAYIAIIGCFQIFTIFMSIHAFDVSMHDVLRTSLLVEWIRQAAWRSH